MARVAIKEESLQNLADLARQTAGTTDTYDIDEAIEILTESGSPALEELTITENGEYTPTAYGYSKVTADVQPELEDITITANGTYSSDKYGFGEVIVECPSPPSDEELTITGNCSYRFANNGWNWLIEKYGDRITTSGITNADHMFQINDGIDEVPFQINIDSTCTTFANMFYYASNLSVCPVLRGDFNWANSWIDLDSIINRCYKLCTCDNLFTPAMLEGFSQRKVTSTYSCNKPAGFSGCYSLRQVPAWWYQQRLNKESTAFPNYSLYEESFNNCFTLDEVLNIPVWTCGAPATKTLFGTYSNTYTFYYCARVQNITFETNEDGTPIEADWKAQVISLSDYVGYANVTSYILSYNSGITADKQVKDDATYQALKDDPDWFTYNIAYSRYNHDSAVATINSLPDTSAYLATAGGTNTIKFKGGSGSATDGGAINTLTEEEIAVAAAKGWTVTLS